MTDQRSSSGADGLPDWEDPRVKAVYDILCDDDLNTPPNPEEHWEGWVSRNIVKALCSGPKDRADYKIGWWLSAALEDPSVCAEMKADINAWFEAHQPWRNEDSGVAQRPVDSGEIVADLEHVRLALATLSDPLTITVDGHLTGTTRALAIIHAMRDIAATAALRLAAYAGVVMPSTNSGVRRNERP